jgi:hypothetical protein
MNRNRRRILACLALAAMMLRALLPDGWMPAATGGAGTVLTICTMDGPVRVALGDDGQPLKKQPAQHNGGSHEICPFAAAPHFATPIHLVAATTPSAAYFSALLPIAAGTPPGRDTHSPQSPRGPPGFA